MPSSGLYRFTLLTGGMRLSTDHSARPSPVPSLIPLPLLLDHPVYPVALNSRLTKEATPTVFGLPLKYVMVSVMVSNEAGWLLEITGHLHRLHPAAMWLQHKTDTHHHFKVVERRLLVLLSFPT